MADILDEHGNPIQLTDELGRPVILTDEHGVPIHLTGVATTDDSGPHGGTTTIGTKPEMQGGTHSTPVPTGTDTGGGGGGVEETVPPLSHPETGGVETEKQRLGRAGSSSSSSSEDDGEGGRRKRKGLMQKIKEKLPGHKSKEEEVVPAKVYTATTKVSVTTPAGPPNEPKPEYIKVEHHEEEHEKKGFMDKIKDKLPGHHSR